MIATLTQRSRNSLVEFGQLVVYGQEPSKRKAPVAPRIHLTPVLDLFPIEVAGRYSIGVSWVKLNPGVVAHPLP